jgi:hypothetical protein
MVIEVEARALVPKKIDEVFAAVTAPENLKTFFTGYFPVVPAITGVLIEGDGVLREGAIRLVELSDGSHVRERIVGHEAPWVHRYEMMEMNALQTALLSAMISEWRLRDEAGVTWITWRCEMHPRSRLRLPAVWVVAQVFRRAMERCLNHAARALR